MPLASIRADADPCQGVDEHKNAAISELREKIDQIDKQIMDLVNQRALHALKISAHKGSQGLSVFCPERENMIINNLAEANHGPLPTNYLKQIFTEIISACREVQRPLRVAFLGPWGTFSHLVALRQFGGSCEFAPQPSIVDVFHEVELGHAPVGLVPVENSSEGGVTVTMDQFMESNLLICSEIYARISHVFMSPDTEIEKVKVVYSHPQALSQCRRWISRNLPRAALVEVASTATAALKATEEVGTAAVGSELLARQNHLNVLARDIQDNPHNKTRFLILGRQTPPPTGNDKTSIMFLVPHEPGSLHKALSLFSTRGINLTHIQSRPTKDRPWEYAFFVDFQGHKDDPHIRQALDALAQEVEKMKVIGSYPMADPNMTD